MSWQLASFGLVALALALSAWWYERSRPPVKLVAVIATLAAVAALGRDAFAALPDVKPITAVVLISGLAFGAGPGFAVGAVSALASNMLLAQGPWTPWQMLGWGAVGLLGGALRAAGPRRLPTLAIALACALGAELFNLIVDLYTWTGTGSHTLAAFGLVLTQAFPFDITHVIASFAFGLLFGSVLLRMLLRVRARMQVQWSAPAALALLLAALLAVPALLGASAPSARAASASAAPRADISRALSYLTSAQEADGGFGAAAGQGSSELYSAWAAIGLAAGGRAAQSQRRDGHSVLDALRSQASTLEGAGDLERTILALHACGASAHQLPGGDPVARLLRDRRDDGSFEGMVNLTAFGALALRAAGYAPSSAALRSAASWLQRQQEPDGGFGFARRSQSGGSSDVDDTGAVLQALAASGIRGGEVVARAIAYIRSAQNPDGGLPEQPGGQSNAQSTAWAIQGLDAAGQDVERISRHGSRSPLAYLESLIAPNGSVRYSRTSAQTPVWVTGQALAALAGEPLPVAPAPSSARGARTRAGAHGRERRSARAARAGLASAGAPAALARPARLAAVAHDVGALLGTVLAAVIGH
jgi:energy-coupling factor transport system substrate-specific component